MGFCSIIEPPVIHKPYRESERRLYQFSNIRRQRPLAIRIEDAPELFEVLEESSPEIPLFCITSLLRRSPCDVRELTVQPEHVLFFLLRLLYLQPGATIAVKLEMSISEHEARQYFQLRC